MRQAEPPHAVACAASPWPINAALRGWGAEGAVCAELGRGLAQLPTANAGAAADEKSACDWRLRLEKSVDEQQRGNGSCTLPVWPLIENARDKQT